MNNQWNAWVSLLSKNKRVSFNTNYVFMPEVVQFKLGVLCILYNSHYFLKLLQVISDSIKQFIVVGTIRLDVQKKKKDWRKFNEFN